MNNSTLFDGWLQVYVYEIFLQLSCMCNGAEGMTLGQPSAECEIFEVSCESYLTQ